MKFTFAFGKQTMDVELDNNHIQDILHTNEVEVSSKGKDEVIRALHNPIGTKRLREIVSPKEKVVIITSDITRPMPSKEVLPLILN